jgi:hypothetical protein
MANVVLALLVVGAIAGALLAIWKFGVLCLLPAISFLVLIALLIGIIERASPGTIALQIIATLVAPQLSYLATFCSLASFHGRARSIVGARSIARTLLPGNCSWTRR